MTCKLRRKDLLLDIHCSRVFVGTWILSSVALSLLTNESIRLRGNNLAILMDAFWTCLDDRVEVASGLSTFLRIPAIKRYMDDALWKFDVGKLSDSAIRKQFLNVIRESTNHLYSKQRRNKSSSMEPTNLLQCSDRRGNAS